MYPVENGIRLFAGLVTTVCASIVIFRINRKAEMSTKFGNTIMFFTLLNGLCNIVAFVIVINRRYFDCFSDP